MPSRQFENLNPTSHDLQEKEISAPSSDIDFSVLDTDATASVEPTSNVELAQELLQTSEQTNSETMAGTTTNTTVETKTYPKRNRHPPDCYDQGV